MPDSDTISIYVDASLKNKKGRIAVVDNDYIISKKIKKCKYNTINKLEFIAIENGLERALHNYSNKEQVIIYSDNLSAISEAKSKYRYNNISFRYIRSSENPADEFAKQL